MKRAESTAQAWNEAHPVGTEVDVRRDNGEVLRTKTWAKAAVIGGMPVVWVNGISGCYLLERVTAVGGGT